MPWLTACSEPAESCDAQLGITSTASSRRRGMRACRPCHRPFPRRSKHQDPRGGGRRLPPNGLLLGGLTTQKRAGLHRGDDMLVCPSPPEQTPTRPDVVLRQGPFLPRDPRTHVRLSHPGAHPAPGADRNAHRLRRGSRGGRPLSPAVPTSSPAPESGASTGSNSGEGSASLQEDATICCPASTSRASFPWPAS